MNYSAKAFKNLFPTTKYYWICELDNGELKVRDITYNSEIIKNYKQFKTIADQVLDTYVPGNLLAICIEVDAVIEENRLNKETFIEDSKCDLGEPIVDTYVKELTFLEDELVRMEDVTDYFCVYCLANAYYQDDSSEIDESQFYDLYNSDDEEDLGTILEDFLKEKVESKDDDEYLEEDDIDTEEADFFDDFSEFVDLDTNYF